MGGKLPGKLLVISGPSGVGKTTVCDALLSSGGFERVVTATSRAPRSGERDGLDYLFLPEKEFRAALERGDFLESAVVHGHLYGTPRKAVEDGLRRGRWILLNIDVQGARQIREAGVREPRLPIVTIFLAPPDLDVLRERLESRGTDPPLEVERRLKVAREEMEERHLYDHVILNDRVALAVKRILKAVGFSGGLPDRSHGPEKT